MKVEKSWSERKFSCDTLLRVLLMIGIKYLYTLEISIRQWSTWIHFKVVRNSKIYMSLDSRIILWRENGTCNSYRGLNYILVLETFILHKQSMHTFCKSYILFCNCRIITSLVIRVNNLSNCFTPEGKKIQREEKKQSIWKRFHPDEDSLFFSAE